MSISVKNITVTIDDVKSSGFFLNLDGEMWRLDNFTLHQSLLSYNTLCFNMHKGPKEDDKEARFALCSQIIGKEITLSLDTYNVENLSLNSNNEKTAEISFQGIIMSASGSRVGSQYIVNVEARSREALLDDNPNCKSFEEMTLNDIVNDVIDLKDGNKVDATVDSRFTDAIAYCVQYNETDYQFLQRLARRYGEWLYNDGKQMVFGNLVSQDAVSLSYPSKDIPSYSVDLKMQHVAFNHITSSYNAYEATCKDGLEEMKRPYNTLGDSVFEASESNFTKPTLQNLHSGGFADQDGRDTILKVSTKTQARGEKAGMLTYSGNTYCSKLKIGATLVIVDNYITDAFTNTKSDIPQDEILITELLHSFSSDESYSNHFNGIPAACDYPPYANSDVYPVAPSCRAKVTDNEDPMDWGRIRVQFDWQAELDKENMKTPWLRIAQPYAGGEKGFSFIPEIGEEVMIDFEGGNAERPYVKGCLFNGDAQYGTPDPAWQPKKDKKDSEESERVKDNHIKAIRTRNGHTIEIHDEGDDGYIRIYDNKKENYILTFSTDEKLIKLESTGNIELYAKNDIIMEAGHDMKIKVGNDKALEVGHNDATKVGNNQSLQVGRDQSVRIGNDQETAIGNNNSIEINGDQIIDIMGNKDEKVVNDSFLSAKNYREEIEKDIVVIATTQQYKSSNSTKIDGGNQIDIKATITKVN